jgi:hypothetical protein
MIQLDVPMVLLDPGLNETPGLSDIDLPTLAGDTVYTPDVFKPRLSFTGRRKLATSGDRFTVFDTI